MRPLPPSPSDGDKLPGQTNGNSNQTDHTSPHLAVLTSTESSAGGNNINASSSQPSSNPNHRFTTPANLDDVEKRPTPSTTATQHRERVRRSSSPAPSSALPNSQNSQGEEENAREVEEEGNGGEAEHDSEDDDAEGSDDDTYINVPFGQANTSLENRLRLQNAQNNPVPSSSAPPELESCQNKEPAEEEA